MAITVPTSTTTVNYTQQGLNRTATATAPSVSPSAPSQAMGKAGMIAQVAGAGYEYHAARQEANRRESKAKKQGFMERITAMDNYMAAVDSLAEQQKRIISAQNIAIATSGFAAGGSSDEIVRESLRAAKKQRSALKTRMKQQAAFSLEGEREERHAAKRFKRDAGVMTALKIAGALM